MAKTPVEMAQGFLASETTPADVRTVALAYLKATGDLSKLRRLVAQPTRPCANYEAVAVYLAKNPQATVDEVVAGVAPIVGTIGRNTAYHHMRKIRAATA